MLLLKKRGFTFKNLLLRHHGIINVIRLSYAQSDSPRDPDAYKKWLADTNRTFKVDMDLQHTEQKPEDFTELVPYLLLEVSCWDLYEQDEQYILEVDLI